jgi:hypothetical protein
MPKQPTDDLFEKSTMTFGEHLEELRVCLFRSVIGLAFGCVIGFFVANWVVRFFQSPLERAMEQYYIDKAVDDFRPMYEKAYRTRVDKVPLEVERMIIDEGIIPEAIQIEPAHIAATLRREYPRQFRDVEISAYWFTPGDFLTGGELQLCRDLDAAKDRSSTASGRIWQSLDDDQRQFVSDRAQSGLDLTVDQTAQLLAILNDVASKRELHDSPEFAAISGPDADFTSTWLTKLWAKLGYREPPQTDCPPQRTQRAIRLRKVAPLEQTAPRPRLSRLLAQGPPQSHPAARLEASQSAVSSPERPGSVHDLDEGRNCHGTGDREPLPVFSNLELCRRGSISA